MARKEKQFLAARSATAVNVLLISSDCAHNLFCSFFHHSICSGVVETFCYDLSRRFLFFFCVADPILSISAFFHGARTHLLIHEMNANSLANTTKIQLTCAGVHLYTVDVRWCCRYCIKIVADLVFTFVLAVASNLCALAVPATFVRLCIEHELPIKLKMISHTACNQRDNYTVLVLRVCHCNCSAGRCFSWCDSISCQFFNNNIEAHSARVERTTWANRIKNSALQYFEIQSEECIEKYISDKSWFMTYFDPIGFVINFTV